MKAMKGHLSMSSASLFTVPSLLSPLPPPAESFGCTSKIWSRIPAAVLIWYVMSAFECRPNTSGMSCLWGI